MFVRRSNPWIKLIDTKFLVSSQISKIQEISQKNDIGRTFGCKASIKNYVGHVGTCCKPLLRDQQLTIRIDHRKLLFIIQASNPMIVRTRGNDDIWHYSIRIQLVGGWEQQRAGGRWARKGPPSDVSEFSSRDVLYARFV